MCEAVARLCTLFADEIGRFDLLDALERLAVAHLDGVLVGHEDVDFVAVDECVVSGQTELTSVCPLEHVHRGVASSKV